MRGGTVGLSTKRTETTFQEFTFYEVSSIAQQTLETLLLPGCDVYVVGAVLLKTQATIDA